MPDARALRAPAVALATLAGLALVALSAWMLVASVRGASYTVDNADFAFVPAQLTVVVGDTVTWTNSDPVPHTATAEDGTFASGALDQGDAYSYTFQSSGAFPYLCDYHPEMAGTITVRAAAAPGSPGQGTAPNTAASRLGELATTLEAIGLAVALAGLAAVAALVWGRRQPKAR